MKWLGKLKEWFTPFCIEKCFHHSDLDKVEKEQGVHCAIWGNSLVEQLDFTTSISRPHLLVFVVNRPQELKNRSPRAMAVLQRAMVNQGFIWMTDLYLFESVTGSKDRTLVSLTSYGEVWPRFAL